MVVVKGYFPIGFSSWEPHLLGALVNKCLAAIMLVPEYGALPLVYMMLRRKKRLLRERGEISLLNVFDTALHK